MQALPAILAVFIPLVAVAGVFVAPVALVAVVLAHRRTMARIEVQRLEAETRLLHLRQHGELPAWVDPRDPAALRAWDATRAEVDATAARHAAVFATAR
jgi:hypothetical protein